MTERRDILKILKQLIKLHKLLFAAAVLFTILSNLSGNVSGFLQNMPGIYANFRRFGAAVGRLEEKLVWKKG